MSATFHPIAPTSDPGRAGAEKDQRRGSYSGADFSDVEDSLPRWRAVALFGALLILSGILFVLNTTGVARGSSPPFPPDFLAIAVVFGAAGLVAAAVGFGTEGLALVGGALVWISVAFFGSASPTPQAAPPPVSTDLGIYLGLIVAGTILVVVGALGLARLYWTLRETAPTKSVPSA